MFSHLVKARTDPTAMFGTMTGQIKRGTHANLKLQQQGVSGGLISLSTV